MHESYQKIRFSLNISWEPGSQVPREFAALWVSQIIECRAAASQLKIGTIINKET